MRKRVFNKEDLVLYLLSKMEPEKSTHIRLNKLAFFVEFGYLYKTKKELSSAKYAAINYGPVIDGYIELFKEMEKKGKIKLDGDRFVRPLVEPKKKLLAKESLVVDELIEKYSGINDNVLVGLSHMTDSYKITTDNEKQMGKIIDKDLAYLESFFDDEIVSDEEVTELPEIDRSKLVEYEVQG